MSDQQRRRAFFVSAVVLIGMCAVVWLFERPDSGGHTEAKRKAASYRPLVASVAGSAASRRPAAATPRRGSHSAASPRSEADEIERVAARFAGAFARYEVGQLSLGVRRTIAATATPKFATSLLSAPPSFPNGVAPLAPPRLSSVALANEPAHGQVRAIIELNGAGGQVETLTVLMARLGQGWRVSDLA